MFLDIFSSIQNCRLCLGWWSTIAGAYADLSEQTAMLTVIVYFTFSALNPKVHLDMLDRIERAKAKAREPHYQKLEIKRRRLFPLLLFFLSWEKVTSTRQHNLLVQRH